MPIKNIIKTNRLKRSVLAIALNFSLPMVPVILVSPPVFSLPQGGQVRAGSAQISTNGGTMNINQGSNKAVIDWRSYNIGKQESVNYRQPNARSISLNRINPNQGPSQIFGSIKANGQVWLVNPAGIWFGAGSHVDVAGLLATTASIRTSDFMNGRYQFQQSSKWNGAVQNDGEIIVRQNGLAALVAPGVVNNGRIEANLGTVVLGASTKFTVDFTGDQLINFAVGGEVSTYANDHNGKKLDSAISNTGTIVSNAGKVIIAASAAGAVLNNTINMQGMVEASSVGVKQGQIVLSGGTVKVSGKLVASGKKQGEKGGTVTITGTQIALTDQANIDVSGDIGGGQMYIGGSERGQGPLPNAENTSIAASAILNADAITAGDGGKIIVWGDNAQVAGTLSAAAGRLSGNGGFIETSGHYLDVNNIKINTLALHGTSGTWLLDPYNVTISTGANSVTFTNPYNASVASSVINTTTLQNALATANVVITTGTSGSETGNITVSNVLSWNSGYSLTLQAANDIIVNAAISMGGASGLNLAAARNIAINAAITSGTGNVSLVTNSQGAYGLGGAGIVTFGAGGSVSTGGNVSYYYNPTSYTASNPANYVNSNPSGSATLYKYINTVADLQTVSGNSALWSNSYALSNDLDLSSIANFNPIGNLTTSFTGNFDGLNHTITDLTQVLTSGYGGLFGVAGGAGKTYKNLTLKYANISGSAAGMGTFITSLLANSTVSNIFVIESSLSNTNSGGVGGLISSVGDGSTVSDVYVLNATINARSGNSGGMFGIVGLNALISNAHSSGTYNTTSVGAVGGLAGGVRSGTLITLSSSSMDINITSPTGTAAGIGGLVGNCPGTCSISQSYSTGDIHVVADGAQIGGLVGILATGSILDSYSTSSIILGGVGGSIGGLVGIASGTIQNTYSSGLVQVGTPDVASVGGLLGTLSSGTVSNSFWDTTTSGLSTSAGGTGINTAAMMTTSTFNTGGATWNIANTPSSTLQGSATWFIFPGQTRPLLLSQLNTDVSTPEQLQLVGAALGTAYNYVQVANIDLSKTTASTSTWASGQGFIPIGATTSFQGTYNGQNYTIDNLYINSSSASNVGLFGNTAGNALLTNIGVTNANVIANGASGYAGILLGYQGSGTASVGDSYSTGTITSSNSTTGGLIGGTIDGSNANAVYDSYSTAIVTASGANDIGGLIGYLGSQATIYATYSGGSVTGGATSTAGGLVGRLSGTILNSYSYASVLGGTAGGLVGLANLNSAMTNTYSSGAVSGSSSVGGFVGSNSGTITGSFWDNQTSTRATGYGSNTGTINSLTGLTTSQFFNIANFTGAGWNIGGSSTASATAAPPTSTWFIFNINGNTRPMLTMEWQTNITNAHQLQMVGSTLGASYTLANDIDLSTALQNPSDVWGSRVNAPSASIPGTGFVPIGSSSTFFAGGKEFKGIFNGRYHTISNLAIGVLSSGMATNVDVGLFGNVVNATIKNVGLEDVNINGQQYMGALVGYGSGSTVILNSYVDGGYINASNNALSVGGLIGRFEGIASLNSGFSNVIINVGSNSSNIGGFIGYLNNSTASIKNAYSLSPIFMLTTGSSNVGGFVGLNSGSILNTYSTGTMRVAGIATAGGFVGTNTGIISQSFWDIATSGMAAGYGSNSGTMTLTGSTFNTTLSTQSTFTNAGWGFNGGATSTSPWVIVAGATYPYLSVRADGYAALSGATSAALGSSFSVAINGTVSGSGTIQNIDHSYYIAFPIGSMVGKDVVVYLTSGGVSGNAVSLANSNGSINYLDIIQDTINVGSSNAMYATALSNADLVTAVGSLSLSSLLYSGGGSNLITLGTGTDNNNVANLLVNNLVSTYTINGNILTQTSPAATTSAYFNTNVILNAAQVITHGAQTYNGTLTVLPGTALLQATGTSGNLTFNGAVTATNLTLSAGAQILQSAAGVFTANALTASAVNGILLDTTTNAIGNFTATNTGSGNINLKNAASTLTVAGASQAGAGLITINNTGNLTTTGAVGTTGTGTIGLTSTNGTLTIGANVSAASANINLTATGANSDVLFTAGTVNTPGNINVNAGRDIALLPASNAIIGSSTTNAVTLTAARDISSATGTEISANAATGSVALNAGRSINSASTIDPANVTFTAGTAISQTGAVTATNLLSAYAGLDGGSGGILINNANNDIASILASNAGYSGNITIVNNNSSITALGLTLGNIANTSGNVSLSNTGSVIINGNVGGAQESSITLTAGNNFTLQSGQVFSAGLIKVMAGNNIVLNGGIISSTSTGFNILLVNGQTSSNTFTNNAGSSAINSHGGHYQIWSYSPTNDFVGNLNSTPDYLQYNAIYGITSPLGSGNGLLYAIAPVLNVGVLTPSRSYNGTNVINLTSQNYIVNSGFINGDNVHVNNLNLDATALTSSANVGTYTINPNATYANNGVTGANSSGIQAGVQIYGYQVSMSSGTAIITPANITVSPNAGLSKVYGTSDPSSVANGYGVTSGQLFGSDTLSGAMGRQSGENVGSYAFTQGSVSANSNYILTFNGSSNPFVILPATVTGMMSNQTKVYGNSDPSFSNVPITLYGLVSATVTDINGNVTVINDASKVAAALTSLSRAAGEDVGRYNINSGTFALTGSSGGNYRALLGGTPYLSITPAKIIGQMGNQTKYYNQADPAAANIAVKLGFVNKYVSTWNGDVVIDDTGLVSVSLSRVTRIPGETLAGNPYYYTSGTLNALTGASAGNYQTPIFSLANQPTLTILWTPAASTVQPTNFTPANVALTGLTPPNQPTGENTAKLLTLQDCNNNVSTKNVISNISTKETSNLVCESNLGSQNMLWTSKGIDNATVSFTQGVHGLRNNEAYVPSSPLDIR